MAFTDITIVGINENSSTRIKGTDLFNVVLNLSDVTGNEWTELFNQRWHHEIYMMKRKARASGTHITIECVPTELETEHLPHLNSVIDEVNATYKKYLAEKQAMKDAKHKQDAEDKAGLAGIGAKLFK